MISTIAVQTTLGRAAAIIKDTLDMRDVAERHGIHFNTHNRCSCPWHDDEHPSAYIKNNRFHCPVCGISYDMIDFVGHLFDLDFRGAVGRLSDDYAMGLTSGSTDRRAVDEWLKKKHAADKALRAYRAEYMRKVKEYRYIWFAVQTVKDKTWRDVKRRAGWLARLEFLDYWFQENSYK